MFKGGDGRERCDFAFFVVVVGFGGCVRGVSWLWFDGGGLGG